MTEQITRQFTFSDLVVTVLAIATAVYYFAARWMESNGILNETDMFVISVLTLVLGTFLAAHALVMIKEGSRGTPA